MRRGQKGKEYDRKEENRIEKRDDRKENNAI